MTVRQKNRLKKRAFGWGMSILRTVFIGGLCFVVLYPLLTMLTSSVMSVSDIYDSSVNYIPKAFTLEHYVNAAKMLGYPSALWNTLLMVAFFSSAVFICSASLRPLQANRWGCWTRTGPLFCWG